MSGAMENRSAVFTSSPQDVEVYRDGTWWAGALLGWRHDSTGGCQVWVRLAVREVEETSWLPLDLLRLPEPAAPERRLAAVGGSGAAAVAEALTGTMAAIRAVPAPRSRSRGMSAAAETTATMNLVAVREVPEDHPVGLPPRRPGGRRRAPEPSTGEQPAIAPETVAPERADLSTADPVTPGRHRAPTPAAASAGRHRATDTGVWPVVRDDEPVRLTELPRRRTSVPALDEPDAHLLTRPMRLSDARDGGIPQPRRDQAGARLSV